MELTIILCFKQSIKSIGALKRLVITKVFKRVNQELFDVKY